MTSTSAASSLDAASLRDAATDGLGYWEPRRLIYDAVLAAVVVTYFFAAWPASRQVLSVDLGLTVFLLAVVANVLYCFAYVADVFVQVSGLREAWLRSRWVLFVVGPAFAATVTRFVVIGLLSGRH